MKPKENYNIKHGFICNKKHMPKSMHEAIKIQDTFKNAQYFYNKNVY